MGLLLPIFFLFGISDGFLFFRLPVVYLSFLYSLAILGGSGWLPSTGLVCFVYIYIYVLVKTH